LPVSGEQCRVSSHDRRTPTVPFTLRDQAFHPATRTSPPICTPQPARQRRPANTQIEMICALLRVSSAPDWNRLNYLVGARRPGCWLGRARADHYSVLFKVWRPDLVVRSSLPAVSGGDLG
jgi:hypothetical protein